MLGTKDGTVRALIAAVPIYMNGECSGSIWGVGGAGEGRGGGSGRSSGCRVNFI